MVRSKSNHVQRGPAQPVQCSLVEVDDTLGDEGSIHVEGGLDDETEGAFNLSNPAVRMQIFQTIREDELRQMRDEMPVLKNGNLQNVVTALWKGERYAKSSLNTIEKADFLKRRSDILSVMEERDVRGRALFYRQKWWQNVEYSHMDASLRMRVEILAAKWCVSRAHTIMLECGRDEQKKKRLMKSIRFAQQFLKRTKASRMAPEFVRADTVPHASTKRGTKTLGVSHAEVPKVAVLTEFQVGHCKALGGVKVESADVSIDDVSLVDALDDAFDVGVLECDPDDSEKDMDVEGAYHEGVVWAEKARMRGVFVKHWDVGTVVSQRGLTADFNAQDWISDSNFPQNESRVTIAVISGAGTVVDASFDVTMDGSHAPLCLVHLITKGVISVQWTPLRSAFQLILCLDKQHLAEIRTSVAFSCFISWVVNLEFTAGQLLEPSSLSQDWVFDVIKRNPHDEDALEYEPFLDRVRAARGCLNVRLRGYQERAVAWMLSRELGPALKLLPDVLWEPARVLAPFCALRGFPVQVVSDLTLNPGGGYSFNSPLLSVASQTTSREAAVVTALGECSASTEAGRGGLLCDEMGLGKTLEVIQLVVSNKVHAPASASQPAVADNCERNADVNALAGPDYQPLSGREKGTKCIGCSLSLLAPFAQKQNSGKVVTCVECLSEAHFECCGTVSANASVTDTFVCLLCCNKIAKMSAEDAEPDSIPRSGATVVVVPASLLLQWQEEIAKHVRGTVAVVVFQGLAESGYLPQRTLIAADIVLTTYDALRADVAGARIIRKPGRTLRYPKRYRPTPTPLLALHWHRIALDESQMLGNGFGLAAEMASNLRATYRWCITGTPIRQSLSIGDALPIFDLIRVGEDSDSRFWLHQLIRPAYGQLAADRARLANAMRKVMWRTSKADIAETELCLPPQTVQVVRTEFGPVEKYHYRVISESVRHAVFQLGSNDTRQGLAQELLTTLRQACCHPQVGSSGRRLMSTAVRQALQRSGLFVSRRGVKRAHGSAEAAEKRAENPLTMQEVLEALVAKARVECQDALRTLAAASNGLAGVSLLEYKAGVGSGTCQHLVTAISVYRETLRLADENRELVNMDSIQRMHVLHNLGDALDMATQASQALREKTGAASTLAKELLSTLGRTIRECDLREEALRLKQNYNSDAQARLTVASSDHVAVVKEIGATAFAEPAIEVNDGDSEDNVVNPDASEHRKRPSRLPTQWWEKALAVVMERGDEESFLEKVITSLMDPLPRDNDGVVRIRTIANRLSNFNAVHYVLSSELSELQTARNALRIRLDELPGALGVEPTAEQVSVSGQCHKCRELGTGPSCPHCMTEVLFSSVERRLYSLREFEGPCANDADFVMSFGDVRTNHVAEGGTTDVQAAKAMVSNALTPRQRSRSVAGTVIASGSLRLKGEIEVVMHLLAPIARMSRDSGLVKEMDSWFKRFNMMKKELTVARALCDAQRSYLASLDEVEMALMRMSLLEENENSLQLTEHEKRFRLHRSVLPTLNVQFTQEREAAQRDFRIKRSSLVYLISLQRMEGGSVVARGNARACAVCFIDFGDEATDIAVFTCGHAFCCDCALAMIRKVPIEARVQTILCPTCRVRCAVDEINFTSLKAVPRGQRKQDQGPESRDDEGPVGNLVEAEDAEVAVVSEAVSRSAPDTPKTRQEIVSTYYDGSIGVRGSVGAKASAVVRVLKAIASKHGPHTKSLVFSEWNEVLTVMSAAMTSNGITHLNGAAVSGKSGLPRIVSRFKGSGTDNVLLLPYRRAGAGLNLIEATHVILVEPCVHFGTEAQAIGRVHRIGQRSATFVHRIIIDNTIEDKVLALAVGRERQNDCAMVDTRVTVRDVLSILDPRDGDRDMGNTGGV